MRLGGGLVRLLLVVERRGQPLDLGPLAGGGALGQPRERLTDKTLALVGEGGELLAQVRDHLTR